MRKTNTSSSLVWAGMTLIFIAVILTLVFFMQGSTTVTGEYPDAETSESLSCVAENISYPIFTYDNSERKNTKIDATFNNNELSSISLTHILYYNDSSKVRDSEAINHAAVNIDSQAADIFGAHYSKFDDAMSMTMYANKSDLNSNTKKYMMLDLVSIDELSRESVKRNYETMGFVCNVGE